MAQFPPEDSLRDVWVKEDSKWIVASVRGSHTISTHIGIDSLADAWQYGLGMLKRWCARCHQAHASILVPSGDPAVRRAALKRSRSERS